VSKDLATSQTTDDEKLIVGKISGVFGVKGWVKVFSETEPRENIVSYSPWLIDVNKQWQSVKIVSGKKHGKAVIAQLDGINDRDQAEALQGARIAIYSSQLPQTTDSEFYWRDLKGLRVVNPTGFDFGVVVDILETGANDVLVVHSGSADKQTDKNKSVPVEYLIPYIWQQVVLNVDLQAGLLKVDWEPDYLND